MTFSDTDVDLKPLAQVADDAYNRAERLGAEHADCIDAAVNAVLDALAAAGRLLPEGAEARTEWSIQWRNGSVQGGKLFTQAGAEQYAADLDATVVQRQVGPWVPVPSPTTQETPTDG